MLAAGGAQTTKVKGVIQQLHHALDVTTPQLSRTLVSPDVVVLENGAGFMNRLHRWICRSGVWKKALQNEMLPWALKDVDLGRNLLEVGPGPGLTTDCLRTRFDRITALEVDTALADLLTQRLSGTSVTVIQGDASAMPFEDGTFSGAVAFTIFHHVPSPTLQDRLLSEVYRVLKPGGVFVGTDSVWSPVTHMFLKKREIQPCSATEIDHRIAVVENKSLDCPFAISPMTEPGEIEEQRTPAVPLGRLR